MKNWLFSTFFNLFGVQQTCTPLEMIQCIQIPFWGHKLHHYWSSGTSFSSGNRHILLWKLPEKWEFLIFSTFLHDFVSNGPVHLWKWITASKYLTGGTNITIFGHREQILALKMAISNPENWLKIQILAIFCKFLPYFWAQWTYPPVETSRCTKIPD